MKNLILMDFDGTFCDSLSMWGKLAREDLKRRGIVADDDLERQLAHKTISEGAAYICAHYPLSVSEEQLMHEWKEHIADFYLNKALAKKGACELLHKWHAEGRTIYCVTLAPAKLVEACFKRFGVADYVAKIISGADLNLGKEGPELFQVAVADCPLPQSEIWVIEDSLFALRTAKKIGFFTIALYDPAHGGKNWQDMQQLADVTAYSWADIHRWSQQN